GSRRRAGGTSRRWRPRTCWWTSCGRSSGRCGADGDATKKFAHEPHERHERAETRAASRMEFVVCDVCVVCGPKIFLSTDHTDHTDGRIVREVRGLTDRPAAGRKNSPQDLSA